METVSVYRPEQIEVTAICGNVMTPDLIVNYENRQPAYRIPWFVKRVIRIGRAAWITLHPDVFSWTAYRAPAARRLARAARKACATEAPARDVMLEGSLSGSTSTTSRPMQFRRLQMRRTMYRAW